MSRPERPIRDGFQNFREYDADFLTKIRMVLSNNKKKAKTRAGCCGNHGQPGC